MAAALLVKEIADLRKVLGSAKSPRLRGVLEGELKTAIAALTELTSDLAELRRLHASAERAHSRAVLAREMRALEEALLGAEEHLADRGASSVSGEGLLDGFCWRPPGKAFEPVPVLRLRQGGAAAGACPVVERMRAALPFVLRGSQLVASAAEKWTPAYLAQHFGADVPCTVFESHPGSALFRYWDARKAGAATQGVAPAPAGCEAALRAEGRGLTSKHTFTMSDFVRRSAEARADPARSRVYLQTSLVQGVGEQIVADFKRFDWMWAQSLPIQLGWGRLTSNVLFVGDRGHVTPAHYDEQQNLLAQLCGRKRVVLWAASDARSLFPFPLRHAHDRQSRLDLDGEGGVGADDVRFARFAAAPAFEALLEPGDALFIPQYWWHRVENLDDGCVSVNFWFVDSEPKPMQTPISPPAKAALRRNVERLMGEAVSEGPSVHAAFCELARARLPGGAGEDSLSADARAMLACARTLFGKILPRPDEVEALISELLDGRFDDETAC